MSIARALGRLLIPDLIKIFTSPTEIVKHLTGTPFSYNRQNMFRDVNNAIGWEKHRTAVQAVAEMPMGLRDTINSWTMQEGSRYRIYGRSTWYDEISGQYITKQSSMYTDVLWEDDEDNENEFRDQFEDDKEKYQGHIFIGFVLDGVEHNVDMPQLRLTR